VTWLALLEILNWAIRVGMLPIVLQRRRTTAAATAWLVVIFFYPLAGIVLYFMLGSTRLTRRRVRLHRAMIDARRSLKRLDQYVPDSVQTLEVDHLSVSRQAEKISGLPVVLGNDFLFCTNWTEVIDRLIADIDAAQHHVHLLFYIFATDATGTRVIEALLRAAKRGIKCRLLADALASRPFLRDRALSGRLREAGVHVAAAMRLRGPGRFLPRFDLRNHRKLAVIDAKLAWVGSQNVVNADYGGRRGAPWFDMMARVTGPLVAELQVVFLEDWFAETGEELSPEQVLAVPAPGGAALAQVVATGPTEIVETYNRVVIALLGAAQREVTLTTPYFAPDESTLLSMQMAADRGVKVTMVVPARGDQIFVGAAGRANQGPLLRAGCDIRLFEKGLIHTKSITVDGVLGAFGSANLDVRSFNLNFELNVLVYGEAVTAQLRNVQQQYLAAARPLTLEEFLSRSWLRRLFDQVCGLLSPLL
jgi:cardiolipin synthase